MPEPVSRARRGTLDETVHPITYVVEMGQLYVDVTMDEQIARVTLDNPAKRNALALDVMLELSDVLREVGRTDALGVVLGRQRPGLLRRPQLR
jgi:1,4-dihydroxy-2-naphthoyl-CoA synthase